MARPDWFRISPESEQTRECKPRQTKRKKKKKKTSEVFVADDFYIVVFRAMMRLPGVITQITV
jgi:hypothetical protein